MENLQKQSPAKVKLSLNDEDDMNMIYSDIKCEIEVEDEDFVDENRENSDENMREINTKDALDKSLDTDTDKDEMSETETNNLSIETIKSKKRRPSYDVSQQMLGYKKAKMECLQKHDSDDDSSFFRSLIPYMKKLPPLSKLSVRSQFQEVLAAEISSMSNST